MSKKKNPNRKQQAFKAAEEIKRIFNGLEVVDAKTDLRGVVTKRDCKGADRRNFGNCVIARACERQFGAAGEDPITVAILRTVAYVEMPDEEGNRRVERFVLAADARAMVQEFDTGGDPQGAIGMPFTLHAPRKSDTLNDKLRRARGTHPSWRERKKKALVNGQLIEPSPKSRKDVKDRKPSMAKMTVRNGTGQIHMTHISVSEA